MFLLEAVEIDTHIFSSTARQVPTTANPDPIKVATCSSSRPAVAEDERLIGAGDISTQQINPTMRKHRDLLRGEFQKQSLMVGSSFVDFPFRTVPLFVIFPFLIAIHFLVNMELLITDGLFGVEVRIETIFFNILIFPVSETVPT
jgi:hypothetical protein